MVQLTGPGKYHMCWFTSGLLRESAVLKATYREVCFGFIVPIGRKQQAQGQGQEARIVNNRQKAERGS